MQSGNEQECLRAGWWVSVAAICFLLLSTLTLAEESEKQSAASEAEPVEIDVPAVTPTPTPTIDESVEPLDVWHEAESSTPTPSASPTPTPEAVEVQAKSLSPDTVSTETVSWADRLLPDEKESGLNKAQKRRWEKLKEQRDERAYRFRKALRERLHKDPRGDRELRLCSANLGNFGEKQEIKRLIRGSSVAGYLARRNNIIQAIIESECDAVAIQGLVGRSSSYAKQGLEILVEKLNKKTSVTWQSVIANSEKEYGFNGFIFKTDTIAYLGADTLRALPLQPFKQFEQKVFARAPLEIEFSLKRKGEGPKRRILLFNFDFLRSIQTGRGELESYRMQLAEALRDYILKRLREEQAKDELDPPVVLLTGETHSKPLAPSVLLFDGRYRLSDFRSGGPCTLEEIAPAPEKKKKDPESSTDDKKSSAKSEPEFTVRCEKRPQEQKIFFNLLHETLPDPPQYMAITRKDGSKKWVLKTSVKKGKKPPKRPEYSQVIMALQLDLPLLLSETGKMGHYAIGTHQIDNGEKASPLVWVDINW